MKGTGYANRLLAVSMCMIVALMGLGGLSTSNVAAHPTWVDYRGPDGIRYLEDGVNMLRFYCDPYISESTPMTAEWICDYAQNMYGTPLTNPHEYCIRVCYWDDALQGWVIHEAGDAGTDFTLYGDETYNVQFNTEWGAAYYAIPIPHGRCPVHPYSDTYIMGGSTWPRDQVGWYSSFYDPHGGGGGGDPPGHTVVKVMASDWMKMLRDGHEWTVHRKSVEYTTLHTGRLYLWNATTQSHQVYMSWDPASDFVVWSAYADGVGGPYPDGDGTITISLFDGIQTQLEAFAYFLTDPE